MDISKIQKSLQSVKCPACSQGSLQAILRCDLDPKECVSKAVCSNCGSNFHINQAGEGSDMVAVCEIDGMQCTLVQS